MMNLNDLTILTVTYNEHLITRMMLKSLQKQLGFIPNVLIIDNSTNKPLDENFKSVFNVIDNTNQRLTGNYNQGSKNHCSTIDYILKNYIKTKWVLLIDNDILFKSTLKTFFQNINEEYDIYGEIGWDDAPPERLFPYFCLINVEKFIKEKRNYFDNDRCIGKNSKVNGQRGPNTKCWYKDTGCSFLEDIKDTWKIKTIKLNDYIVHMKCTGTANKNYNYFLSQNLSLFN